MFLLPHVYICTELVASRNRYIIQHDRVGDGSPAQQPGRAQERTAEIISTVGTSRLLQESDLANLPYLRCIVTETLRLHPVAPNLLPHEASRGFTVAGGHAIGRGTVVLVDVYSMQRDPRVWDEPEKFMPERFLEAKVDDDEGTRWMMPFGMGRRRCPGEGLALRTVGMALGVMVQFFEWERVGKEEVDMSEGSSGITMPMGYGNASHGRVPTAR